MANPWAHWQYTPEKWVQWANNQREWEEAQEESWSWKMTLLFVLLCGGIFALGALMDGASLQENVRIVGVLTGLIMLLALVAYWIKRTHFDRRYRRLLAATPESYFGDEGMFCNGTYTPWMLSGRYLLKATATSDPPARVMFVFQSFNGSSSALVAQRVSIPDGHISELPMLQRKLNARCPIASVHLIARKPTSRRDSNFRRPFPMTRWSGFHSPKSSRPGEEVSCRAAQDEQKADS